jgi:hypothetical protein
VEGNLIELDPAVLAAIRSKVAEIDGPLPVSQAVDARTGGMIKNHLQRQTAQRGLREALQLWGGWREHLGEPLQVAQSRFWHLFGVDVLTAQTLGAADAFALEARVRTELTRNNVVTA